ncbi:hypothetical protein KCP69_15585 [Salmonella enterica subsp. enterica]|nr:hypothetical protein KCP69_15585 [Salmonella enterica subsp. enterica]
MNRLQNNARANRQYPESAIRNAAGHGAESARGQKVPIMSYSGLVAYRFSFIDIDGATVVSDPLSSQNLPGSV